jgi:triphosphatase
VQSNASDPICEIELELKAGGVAALYDVALDLLAVAPVRLERRSKSARGFRLAGLPNAPDSVAPDAVTAVHASEVALDPDMTAGAALRRVVRSCIEQIVGNEAAVLAGMPEGVHQMRVGVRRLRAILSAFAPLLEEEGEAGKLSDELRWLGDVLGHARNLDAFAEGLFAPASEAIGDEPGVAALNAALARTRAAAYRDAAEAIFSPRYSALVLRLMRWSEESGAGDHLSSALALPLAKVAPKILQRRFKQARRRGARFAKQSPQERHRLRIAMIKLRYATEMLGQLYEGGKPRRLLRIVKRLQEELGKANDLHVSHDLVAELARGEPDAAAIAAAGDAVLDRHARRLEQREGKVKKQVTRIRDYSSFW